MQLNVSGAKHAFITGGASGLGLSIGKALASRGICVTLADVDEAALAAAYGGNPAMMQGVVLDTRDRARWESARQEAEAAFGPVDILVNNAGIAPDGSDLADMDPLCWDRIIAINLTGVANGIFTFVPSMQQRRSGFIVNTASMSGLLPGYAGRGGYASAKAGVVGISECLRAELAADGIGVAVLCPGLVSTNLARTTAMIVHGLAEGNLDMPHSDISADAVGEITLRAIERDLTYIVTHRDEMSRVQERTEMLRQAHQIPVPSGACEPILDKPRLRHAFVTGGASGIGSGIAQALLAQGLKVTVADIDDDALAAATASREDMIGLHLDVRDRAAWARTKQEAEARFGPVDVLINNAGITSDGWPIAETNPQAWDRIIDINLTGVFNGVSTYGADMRGRGHGHIVNTASIVGLISAVDGLGGYAAAKNGVVALSEALRAEMAAHGVGVTCLCPGYVATNLHANTMKLGPFKKADRAGGKAGLPLPLVGAVVVEAIAANQPYALTHPSTWPAVETRQQMIQSAWGALD